MERFSKALKKLDRGRFGSRLTLSSYSEKEKAKKKNKGSLTLFKATVAIIDIVATFVVNLCILIDGNDRRAGIAATVLYGFFAVLVVLVIAVGGSIYCCWYRSGKCANPCEDFTCNTACETKWIVRFCYVVGVILYFVGDNGITVFDEYLVDLGAAVKWRDVAVILARMSLALGALLQLPRPIYNHVKKAVWKKDAKEALDADSDVSDESKNEKDAKAVVFVCTMLALVVDLDTIFTLFEGLPCNIDENNTTSIDVQKTNVGAGSTLIIVFGIVFALVVLGFTYYYRKVGEVTSNKAYCYFCALLCIVIGWCHLIADNSLPWDCTEDVADKARDITKFVCSSISVLLAVLVVLPIWCRCGYIAYNERNRKKDST